MYSTLVVNNENIDKSSIISTLKENPEVYVTEVSTLNEALELFSKRYFEILFLDSSVESAKNLQNFKADNPNIVIVCIYEDLDEQLKDTTLDEGVRDYINLNIDSRILKQRIINYLDLSRLNTEVDIHSDCVNLFGKKNHNHFLTFKLNSSESKLAFWDYFSSSYFEQYKDLDESIDLLYAFTSWMFLNKRECKVIKETDDEHMYLTLLPIDYMSEKVINNLIEKYGNNIDFKLDTHKLSIKLSQAAQKSEKKSSTSNLDEETKSILSKAHDEKITATEFLDSTPIEFVNKIEELYELENGIDEALINFEQSPSIDNLAPLSQAFLQYVDMIEMLVDFQHLSYALKTLASSIDNIKEEQLNEKDVKKFTTLTINLLNDLSQWRENIFIKQEANDIHYLDSSLLSSCLQIEAIFEKEKIEEDEDDFELF
jgi:two-component system chemotaxis response regulator CheY